MAEETKGVGVPKWDGKKATAGTYLDKLQSTAEYYNVGDALDARAMTNCPTTTKEQYEAFTDAGELRQIALYKANNRAMAIICWETMRRMQLQWPRRRRRMACRWERQVHLHLHLHLHVHRLLFGNLAAGRTKRVGWY